MTLAFNQFELRLTHPWTIASSLAQDGKKVYPAVFVELRDGDGVIGLGEAAPSNRYRETAETCVEFFRRVEAARLSFEDVRGSMAYAEALTPGNHSPKGAINIALLDGAAKRARKPLHDYLSLGFTEGGHITSFTIGIDTPEMIRRKVREAEPFPILKLKVGAPNDAENLAAVREIAPTKIIRVDANEAWLTKDEALRQIERLARDPRIEFIEQPMPASAAPEDFAWLKERSPLPIFGDELYQSAADADRCARCVHGVNVKLVKTGGMLAAKAALEAARDRGLRTMLGCMIESSLLISAGAHLAELADHLDLDGNLLITNDPYEGVRTERGVMSFAGVGAGIGLRTTVRD